MQVRKVQQLCSAKGHMHVTGNVAEVSVTMRPGRIACLTPETLAQIVAGAVETRNVVAVCCHNELLRTMLPTLLEQLEMCQKSLTAYLETKRAEFPRFYFVSDPTLLEILSLGSDPAAVVPHFQSGLFDSLTSITFDKARSWQGTRSRWALHAFYMSDHLSDAVPAGRQVQDAGDVQPAGGGSGL